MSTPRPRRASPSKPARSRRFSGYQSRGRFPTGSSGFGMLEVRSVMREPPPAAITTAWNSIVWRNDTETRQSSPGQVRQGRFTPPVPATAPGTDSAAMAARPRCACARTAESVDRERAPMESINHLGGLRAAFTQPGRREEHRTKDPALPSAESWIPAQPRGALGGTAPPGGCRKDGGGVMGGSGGSV